MKHYPPADTRFRETTLRAPATPLRSYLANRPPPTAAVTDPPEERNRAVKAGQQAHKAAQRSAPFWLRLLPFGAQWIELRAENARNAAQGKTWRYTVVQIIGALLLYVLITKFAGTGVVQL